MRTLELKKKKFVHVNMRGSLGYQEFTEQFIFNGGMKMLFEMFCSDWSEAYSSFSVFLFCLSLPVARCAHLRMCVQLCVCTHTHTHNNSSGLFIHWKFARAKKRNKVQCL